MLTERISTQKKKIYNELRDIVDGIFPEKRPETGPKLEALLCGSPMDKKTLSSPFLPNDQSIAFPLEVMSEILMNPVAELEP